MSLSSKAILPMPTTARPDEPCAASTDLTWLMHRAASRLRMEFDLVARDAGLGDVREWVVLTALADGMSRTQLELGRLIGVDKTTLMAILDRMEQRELIVRTVDPSDRRVRIPQATPSGLALQLDVSQRRDAQEKRILAEVSPGDQQVLRNLLAIIAQV
ncbi:MAG: putative MarR-family transcriptional regulator [Pseudonocardiales bacterium]|nr:putative MarR-family transcriptional regulator [Pseudonocardiales bacterium]